jgi:hypothetical protein
VAPRTNESTIGESKLGFRLNGCDHAPIRRVTWTQELDAELRRAFEENHSDVRSVIEAILGLHPDLPKALLWERIIYLGLSGRQRPPYEIHHWSPEDDELLRAEYALGRTGAISATRKVLARHPSWSHDAVAARARVLGLTNHRSERPVKWDSHLDNTLLEMADCKLETIARRMNISPKAVLSRLRTLGFDADFFGGHKTKDLELYLNISAARVNRWVRSGLLARKAGRITEESLCRLCRQHPELIPFDTLTAEAQTWVRSLGYEKPTT